MASKIRADAAADKTANAIKRKTADAKFAKTQKTAPTPLLDQPKVLLALPTAETYVVQMAKVQRAKKTYEKAKADAKSASADAKAKYDDAITTAVAALVGRSVSKTSFLRMVILETRRAAKGEDEVTAEIKGESWMLNSGGFEVGEQITFPGFEGTNQKNDAALISRAKKQGIEAGVAAKVSLSDNPHHPGSPQGQSWLEGYHEGQAANAAKIKAPAPPKVASLDAARKAKAEKAKPPVEAKAEAAPVKRGRGRPPKAKEPKEGDVTDALKDAAE